MNNLNYRILETSQHIITLNISKLTRKELLEEVQKLFGLSLISKVSTKATKKELSDVLSAFKERSLKHFKPDSYNELVEMSIEMVLISEGEELTLDLLQKLLLDGSFRFQLGYTEKRAFSDNTLFALAGESSSSLKSGVELYQQLIQNLRYVQLKNNISGLTARYFSIADKLISFYEHSWEFWLLPSDLLRLKADVQRLFEIFIQLSKAKDCKGELVYDLKYEGLEEGVRAFESSEHLKTWIVKALDSDFLGIYPTSREWEPTKNGSYVSCREIKRFNPDEIRLAFGSWSPEDQSFNESDLVLLHRDKSRYPWKD
jgi:hypothetical protein